MDTYTSVFTPDKIEDTNIVVSPPENKYSSPLGNIGTMTVRRVLSYRQIYPESSDYPGDYIFSSAKYRVIPPPKPGGITRVCISLPMTLISNIRTASYPDPIYIKETDMGPDWIYVTITDINGMDIDLSHSDLRRVCIYAYGDIEFYGFSIRLIKDHRKDCYYFDIYQTMF